MIKFFILHTYLSLTILIPMLLCIAFFTLIERKIIAAIQRRRGPNVVGFWGLLQPFADGLKLILKEIIVPLPAKFFLFLSAPLLTFVLSLSGWAFFPFNYGLIISNVSLNILYTFMLSSFGVYGIILAGWASQSRYPFLGGVRSAAQMISYEVSLGVIFLIIALCTSSLNYYDIVAFQHDVCWLGFIIWPIMLIFFITILAETNRTPFDLPEAEAELVAGYNLEYSSIIFALFFLSEYNSIILMSNLLVTLFLGGWLSPLTIFVPVYSTFIINIWWSSKVVLICVIFIIVRATLPRYRYDHLMDIGWKIFLPVTLGYLLFIWSIFVCV